MWATGHLATAQVQPSPLAAKEPGLLLLRNGQLLEGKITPEGDRYFVELASGKVWVKTADVEVHCRNLEEGYWAKRRAMPLGHAPSHLDLAQWCLQYDLLGHAANELRDALAADPHQPRIALLERRLKLAQQKTPPATAAQAELDTAPSAGDLDRLLRGLPDGAVETFTNSIQPLLINSCTAAGCHGPAAEHAPRWARVSARTSSRRLTQRNLHTTLELIDREKPLESRLLTSALQAHGTAKTAALVNRYSPRYRQLAAWVQQVAQTPAIPHPSSVTTQTPPLAQTLPSPGVQRVNFETPLPPAAPVEEESPDEADAGIPAPVIRIGPGTPPSRETPQRGALPAPFQPKDPFDPAIFNRRFFPERK